MARRNPKLNPREAEADTLMLSASTPDQFEFYADLSAESQKFLRAIRFFCDCWREAIGEKKKHPELAGLEIGWEIETTKPPG